MMLGQPTFPRAWIGLLLGLTALLSLLAGCGNPAPRTYRVGIMAGLDFFSPSTDGFKSKLTELGYIEGRNIVYDIQHTNVDPPREQEILKKFVSDKVDLIFSFPTEASLAAKQVTQGTNVPVVFADAVIEGTNLVNSVREPGANLTGVRFPGADLSVKRLEILHQMAPNARRIYVAYLKGYPIVPPELDALRPAAQAMGVTLVEFAANGPAELQADLDARDKAGDIGMDAILIITEPLTVVPDNFGILAKFAAAHKIPVGGADITSGEYRSLFGWTPDARVSGEQAALLADKILKGTAAGTLPVVSPESVLVINYKQAQELGLTVESGLLEMANQVIR